MIKMNLTSEKSDKILNIVSTQIQGLSYSSANKILRKKDIRINDKKISENISVNAGDKITIFLPDDYKTYMREENFFNIEYEDENIIVINKNKGIEASSLRENITVETFLNKKNKVYAINKLDKNTEGLVLFAKSRNLSDKLKKSIKKGEIELFYLAEVVGVPKWKNFTATGYLLKDKENNKIIIFDTPRKDSKKITTEISVLSTSAGGTSIFIFKINNDKINQVRAHLSYIGYPIIGDGKYGKNEINKKFKAKNQRLTAYKIIFNLTDNQLKYLNEKNIEISSSWME